MKNQYLHGLTSYATNVGIVEQEDLGWLTERQDPTSYRSRPSGTEGVFLEPSRREIGPNLNADLNDTLQQGYGTTESTERKV